jgi:catalase
MTRHLFIAASVAALLAGGGAQAQTADPQPIVDLMYLNSNKAKNRPSGGKGQCYTGTFVPTAEARGLSRAVIFTRTSPVVARFSVGGGNVKVPDAARGPNRGFSFRIDPGGAGQTEFVMVNAPMNFARTPQQMLEFLQVRRPQADGKPADPDKIKAWTDANPETTAQGRFLASKPIPGSWVGVNYWGIHAYTLTNATGANQVIKLRMVPTAGEVNLTDDEAKAKPADYLADELADRLKTGKPASFDMMAIMGRAGDHVNDVTKLWDGEDTRPMVKLGTLKIAAVEKNETCDSAIFAPTILADGIAGPAAKDDPMFEIRTPAYAISITNRAN